MGSFLNRGNKTRSAAEYKEKHELLLNLQMTCKANNIFLRSTQQPLYVAYMEHLVTTPEYKQYLIQAIKHGELKTVQLLLDEYDSSITTREHKQYLLKQLAREFKNCSSY